jgi:hypothetical protein
MAFSVGMSAFGIFHSVIGDEAGPPILGPSALEDMLAEKLERHRDREEQNKLSAKVLVMQPILRFLQLLCENHNRYLQVCINMLKGMLLCFTVFHTFSFFMILLTGFI